MKAPSLLLTASVIGAVALGGAVTGATVASFTDSSPIPAEPLRTGSLALEIDASPENMSAVTPGAPGLGLVSLAEAAEGKNLETRRVVKSVAVTGLPAAALDVSFRETNGANVKSCPEARSAYLSGGTQTADTPLGAHGRPGQSTRVCLRVDLTDQARGLLGVGRHTGSLTVEFESQQIRDDKPAGWRSTTSTGPIPVPVVVMPTAPRDVSCTLAGHRVETLELVLAWPRESGVVDSRVHRVWQKKSELWPGSSGATDGMAMWRIRLADVITEKDVREFLDGDEDAGETLSIEAGVGDLWSEPTLVSVEPAPAPQFVRCT